MLFSSFPERYLPLSPWSDGNVSTADLWNGETFSMLCAKGFLSHFYTSLSFICSPNWPCPACKEYRSLPQACSWAVTAAHARSRDVPKPNSCLHTQIQHGEAEQDWCLNLYQWQRCSADGTLTSFGFWEQMVLVLARTWLGSWLFLGARGHHGWDFSSMWSGASPLFLLKDWFRVASTDNPISRTQGAILLSQTAGRREGWTALVLPAGEVRDLKTFIRQKTDWRYCLTVWGKDGRTDVPRGDLAEQGYLCCSLGISQVLLELQPFVVWADEHGRDGSATGRAGWGASGGGRRWLREGSVWPGQNHSWCHPEER